MADQPAAQPQQQTEQPEVLITPDAANYAERRRAAAVAALDALGTQRQAATAPGTPSAPVQPTPPAKPEPTPELPPEPATPPVEKPDDLAAIRKQEIHLRRQFDEQQRRWAAEREQEQASVRPQLEELQQWKQRQASAKDDPIAYLKAAGFTDDDLDPLARMIYAHSPEGAKDPKNKVAAVQTKAQREAEAKLASMQKRLDDFERQQTEAAEQARIQAQIDGYYSTVAKSVGDDSPIVRNLITSMPDVAKQRMLAIADRMYTESSPYDDLREVPQPAAVIKAYEQERRTDLETGLRALGIDPAAVYKLAAVAPAGASPAQPAIAQPTIVPANGAARATTTLPVNGAAPTQIQRPGRKSREELAADVDRMVANQQRR